MKNPSLAVLLSLFLLLVASPVQAADPNTPKATSQNTLDPITAPLYTSINTQTLAAIMKSEGYSITPDQDGDIIWKIEGLNAALIIAEKGDSLLFQTSFSDAKATLKHINTWNQTKRYSRSYLADDNRIVLELDLSLEGGVGKARIIDYLKTCRLSLSIWTQEVVLAE